VTQREKPRVADSLSAGYRYTPYSNVGFSIVSQLTHIAQSTSCTRVFHSAFSTFLHIHYSSAIAGNKHAPSPSASVRPRIGKPVPTLSNVAMSFSMPRTPCAYSIHIKS
jgi:hypothetical protein